MNFCPSCGKPLNPATRFCAYCGAAVAAESLPVPEAAAAVVLEASAVLTQKASRKTWPVVAVCAVAAIAMGWIYASPYLALRSLKQAALSGNTEALKDTVDFPALRASLKEELGGQLSMHAVKEMNKDDEPFAALGTALAGGLVNVFIDQFVTPQVVAGVVQGKKIGGTPGELPEIIDRFAAEPKTGAAVSEPKVLTG